MLLWGHISIHDKCTVFSEGLNNERRNEVLSLCPLKYTPLSPFLPSPTSYFLHPYSDNFALISAPGLCFPIQPSYFHYIILLKYSLHQLIYLTKGLPSWLTFSYFIKSKITLPPFRSYCPLNLVYLLYFRQCLGLPCVDIHTRLEESWGEWKSKNWPRIWGRQNPEGGPGEFLGIARLNNISEKNWSQVNRKMQTTSGALRKGATSPNRWVGPRHRKSKDRWNSELQGSRPHRKLYLWETKHKPLGHSSEGMSRFSGWAIRPMKANKIEMRAGRTEHQGTKSRGDTGSNYSSSFKLGARIMEQHRNVMKKLGSHNLPSKPGRK